MDSNYNFFLKSKPPLVNFTDSSKRIYRKVLISDSIFDFYPDMELYEEILFLQHYFNGNWSGFISEKENIFGNFINFLNPNSIGFNISVI